MMTEFFPIYVYFGFILFVVLIVLGLSAIFPSKKTSPAKFLPYESGILTDAHLFQKRFPMRHYLVALIFLVLDIEVIFLYPWAVIAKTIGPFAFFEMVFFLFAILVGFVYIWRKGGLQWQ